MINRTNSNDILNEKNIIKKLLEFKNDEAIALVTYDKKFSIKKQYTWKDYISEISNFSRYLDKHSKKNVAIHAYNRPEWFFAALGSVVNQKHFCGVYNTNSGDQCVHILKTGECDLLIVENEELLLNNYSTVLEDLEEIKIIIIDKNSTELDSSLVNLDIVYWYDEIYNNTSELKEDLSYIDNKISNSLEDETVTMIFTSGTISNPKAVKISHKNLFAAMESVSDTIHFHYKSERIVSYLPLSHIAGLALDMICPLWCGGQVHFARPDAFKGSLKNSLVAARPTIFLGVPRVWEKLREGITDAAQTKYVGLKGNILREIVNISKEITYCYGTEKNKLNQQIIYPFFLASNKIVSKAKEALGLDKCRYFVSGAAPISHDTLKYFMALNIPIFEIYGMSETTGIITISDPITTLSGSCGKPAKNIDVKISDNNEILVKGDNVFSGYHNYLEEKPSIDEDGYLHTGDCGKLVNGNLYITGRIKELIITSGGENIPPVLIENTIKKIGKFGSHCILIGDKRKFLSLLIFNPADEPELNDEYVQKVIDEYNNHYAISNSQKIQKFKLINDGLTIENNLLTPTMKYKRSLIEQKYRDVIESFYSN